MMWRERWWKTAWKAGVYTILLSLLLKTSVASAAQVLVEAEGFDEHGGWVLDPQFLDVMGSPYLLAHGLGQPVANAVTQVEFPVVGPYRLWVRTMDWVPSHHPGRFRVVLDGREVPETFGDRGEGWIWQDGGLVTIEQTCVRIELRDLTGFDGRCDALFFTTDEAPPPALGGGEMRRWRRTVRGLSADPTLAPQSDVVVVGGGLAGCSAALTAARQGLRVSLVQNRPVLGGNASREIGIMPRGNLRSIVDEIAGPRREEALRSEPRIELYLGWHVFAATVDNGRIESVDAIHTRTNQQLRFIAPLFIDCSGTGAIGYLAGADYRLGREARDEFQESLAPETADQLHHGNTVVFATRMGDAPTAFPEVSWATAVSRGYADLGGQVTADHDNVGGLTHYWEYGQRLDPFTDAEAIRDHLLRAIYGTFATAKQLHPETLSRLELDHVGHVPAGGESRRLMGDYILTENDVRSGRRFADDVALCSGHFCLHYPGDEYDFRLGDWKWIPVPKFGVPLRCLYSCNVENLLMAGKHISVTHIAGSATKTMFNGGQTGVATGAAAALCVKYATTPRAVGRLHVEELQALVAQPGLASPAAP